MMTQAEMNWAFSAPAACSNLASRPCKAVAQASIASDSPGQADIRSLILPLNPLEGLSREQMIKMDSVRP